MTTEPIIETRGLGRDFGHRRALGALNLTVAPGTLLALLGPNGAGKSTLLRLLAGLIEPTRGSARVLGRDPRSPNHGPGARLACLIDGCEPPDTATGLALLELQACVSPIFARGRAFDLCFAGEVSPNARYGTLSKGQRRRLLAGLTVASGAPLMLLDEPADGLDTAARRTLYDCLRTIVNESGATAIVSTHLLHDIERIADEVAILHHGSLLLHSDLEDLREQVRAVEAPPGVLPAELLEFELFARHCDEDTERCLLRARGGRAGFRNAARRGRHSSGRAGGILPRADRRAAARAGGKRSPFHSGGACKMIGFQLARLGRSWLFVPGLLFWALLAAPRLARYAFVPYIIIFLHSHALSGELTRFRARDVGWLYTRGATRDALWGDTLLAAVLSIAAAWLPAALAVWFGVRGAVQQHFFDNPWYPLMTPAELMIPWHWLAGYALLVPPFLYAGVRRAVPMRGQTGADWLALAWVAALVFGAMVASEGYMRAYHPLMISVVQTLAFVPPLILFVAAWRVHRHLEVV